LITVPSTGFRFVILLLPSLLIPERRATLVQAIDLRLDLRHVLQTLDEHARILDHLRAAEALAERLDDPQRLGLIAGHLCFYFVAMGEYNRAMTAGQRALATTSGAFDVQVCARTNLGLAYSAVGDFAEGAGVGEAAVQLAEAVE
jgi:hypothetical protein